MEDELGRLEKNFEVFSRGVERLQELEQELKHLNTNGFEKDAEQIRSELHNVTEIPQIERQIAELKKKISCNQQQNNGTKNTTLKQFDGFLNGITKRLETKLTEHIENRHNEFHTKFKNFYKQKIAENNTALAQVDFMRQQIKELRNDINSIKEQLRAAQNSNGQQTQQSAKQNIPQISKGKLLHQIKDELERVEVEEQEIDLKQDIYYETLQEILDRIKKLLEAKEKGDAEKAENTENPAEKTAAEENAEKEPENREKDSGDLPVDNETDEEIEELFAGLGDGSGLTD